MDIATMILSSGNKSAKKADQPVVNKSFNEFFQYMVSAINDTRKTSAPKREEKIVEDAQSGGFALAIASTTNAQNVTPKKSGDTNVINPLNATKQVTPTMTTNTTNTTQPEQPLDATQQEVLERITVLAVDNGLDPELLTQLNNEELTELAQWILNNTAELFSNEMSAEDLLIQQIAAENVSASASAAPTGLQNSTAALLQLEQLRQRLGDAEIAETALIGKLIALEKLTPVAIDKLAQTIIDTLNADDASIDLRQLLLQTPTDELRANINETLKNINAPIIELPAMPDVVLRSLSIEIVNVNNAEVDAAEKQLALLDGLNNNAKLRADILSQVTGKIAALDHAIDEKIITPEVVAVLLDEENIVVENEIIAKNEVTENETASNIVVNENSNDNEIVAPKIIHNAKSENVSENAKVVEKIVVEIAPEIVAEIIEEVIIDHEKPSVKKVITIVADKNTDEVEVEVIKTAPRINNKTPEKTPTANNENLTVDNDKNATANNNANNEINVNDKNRETGGEKFFTNEKTTPEIKTKTAPTETVNATTVVNNESDEIVPEIDTNENRQIANFTRYTENKLTNIINANNEQVNNSRQAILQDNINRLTDLIAQTKSNEVGTLKSLTLTLNPPELGEVRVEIEIVAAGKISATVKTENENARNLLSSGLENLRKSLESNGISLEKFNVELGGKDAGQQREGQAQNLWFGAQAEERDRRARQSQQLRDLGNLRGNNEVVTNEETKETLTIRAGSSFELIA